MKILCLGNADNIGARLYTWLKAEGKDVTLMRTPFDEGGGERSDPELYNVNPKETHLINLTLYETILPSLFSSKNIRNLNKKFDIVLITGGLQALFYSRKINLPKIFLPIGYEIGLHAAGDELLKSYLNAFKSPVRFCRSFFRTWLARDCIKKTDRIQDFYPPDLAVLKKLNVMHKVTYRIIGEDTDYNHSLVSKKLLKTLNKDTQNSKRIFLFLSRLHYTNPKAPDYKGVDIFIKALETQVEHLKSQELLVIMGNHGEKPEVQKFFKLLEKSPIKQYIKWVSHLDLKDLLAYLSMNNVVLFTDFGCVNSGISGIGRDAYTMGTPLVNSTKDELMFLQYGGPGPRVYAENVEEISNAMKFFMNISQKEYEKIKEKTLDYSKQYLDKKHYIKILLADIDSLTSEEV